MTSHFVIVTRLFRKPNQTHLLQKKIPFLELLLHVSANKATTRRSCNKYVQKKEEIIMKQASFLQTLSCHQTRLLKQELFTIYTTTGYVTDKTLFIPTKRYVKERPRSLLLLHSFVHSVTASPNEVFFFCQNMYIIL